jgi:AcrR family transcriptional regulator
MVTAIPNGKADPRWLRTRQRLLEGGRNAFANAGVEATTVLQIVRAAGVSQPSFYNHFNSKDELAREIVAEFFRNDRKVKLAVFAQIDDPAEAIAINIDHTLSIATADPVIASTLIKSETLRDLVIFSSADPLVDMIKAGVRKGRFNTSSPHTIALVIRGAALALVQNILNGTTDDNASRCFQELVLRMLGLTPAESTEVAARSRQRRKQGLGKFA